MIRSARRHGLLKDATRLLAFALIATMSFGPIASSWHELTVRHVVCAEHGELTHVRAMNVAPAATSHDVTSVANDEGNLTEGHEHCSSGFLVRARLHLSVIRPVVRYTPPPAITREVLEIAVTPGRAFVLASAPKTSPPAA